MDKKIKVVVAGRNFTLTTSDEAAYVEKVAEFVSHQIGDISEASHASTLDSAVMCALNIADGYFKEVQYLDEVSKIKLELSETKRELFRLQQGGK